MTYATRDSMLARYGERTLRELTDKDRQLGVIVDETLNQALVFGNGRVDGALLAGGHALPLSAVDPVLRRHAESLARWTLSTGERPQNVVDDYDAAIGDLDLVAKRKWFPAGTVQTNDSGGTTASSVAGGTRTMRFGAGDITAYQGMRDVRC